MLHFKVYFWPSHKNYFMYNIPLNKQCSVYKGILFLYKKPLYKCYIIYDNTNIYIIQSYTLIYRIRFEKSKKVVILKNCQNNMLNNKLDYLYYNI